MSYVDDNYNANVRKTMRAVKKFLIKAPIGKDKRKVIEQEFDISDIIAGTSKLINDLIMGSIIDESSFQKQEEGEKERKRFFRTRNKKVKIG